MTEATHWTIFINAALINNFVLAYFLGLCPFFGVSTKLDTAVRMGGAVSFVMLVASTCAFFLNLLLEALGAPYLRIVSYVMVISSTVQLIEMLLKKLSPATFRALGIYLPLITTNCAILGLALFQANRGYGFSQSIAFALGAGAGFALALVLMAGIRQKLELATVPELLRGTPVAFVVAGVLSMGFMGFAGLGR
ncbi:MAG: RnfABCDGE type electron transport complex subunit A [Gammaproteobacteria bacterium]|nr:RnfABCDGE type electron transport complex subunit A [Gammaproteobacteria bacterium]NNM01609.1 RnfABCDGE type electron transport complex subunit A [Gammaproteobacteria bacterium]